MLDRTMRYIALGLLLAQVTGCSAASGYRPRNGDIVFQTSTSSQSLAIQLATRSPYSHMGIVYIRDGAPLVFEAVQPVRLTPLATWIKRGERGRFVAKRVRNADAVLTAATLRKMRQVGETFAGRDYDLYFEWSDERIYCSSSCGRSSKEAQVFASGSWKRSRTLIFRTRRSARSSRSDLATRYPPTKSSYRLRPCSIHPASRAPMKTDRNHSARS